MVITFKKITDYLKNMKIHEEKLKDEKIFEKDYSDNTLSNSISIRFYDFSFSFPPPRLLTTVN